MSAVIDEARLTSFLVKVASRCNLDCDYCYVYHHADQSWRSMPPLLAQRDRDAFARQLSTYVRQAGVSHCMVVLHGGEPLLMPRVELVSFARQLRSAVGDSVQLDISLQTNGLLLTPEVIEDLRSVNIGISLSLDGPRAANDLHRNSRKGRSSFDRAVRGLELLKTAPEVFTGVIAVIDPRTPPRELLEFFAAHAVPRLDFLLPDAHHMRLPPGRQAQPDLYERWLIDAFDIWFDEYPTLEVRIFEALLDAVAGLPSRTDALGFGDVSLITIETDGSYHDLDVLKVVRHGATKLIGSVMDTSIADVAASPALAAHRQLLRKEGLCDTCQACDVVEICGGGAVPHRHGLNGFRNPTVYCREMKALIRHVRSRVLSELTPAHQPLQLIESQYASDLAMFERAEDSATQVTQLWAMAVKSQALTLQRAVSLFGDTSHGPVAVEANKLLSRPEQLEQVAGWPGAVAWSNAMLSLSDGRAVHTVDGTPLQRDGDYLSWLLTQLHGGREDGFQIHQADRWLRLPFGRDIVFEPDDLASNAVPLLHEALQIIADWRPALAQELKAICRAIQFVRDPNADPDKIVSFSDNALPGALFVSVYQRGRLIDAYDLADSLVHEYRHQKLYLLERVAPVVERTTQKVISPWRHDLRPPSGLFHAIFVFVELRRFWKHVQRSGIAHMQSRATNQLADTEQNLASAFSTLESCPLTPTGMALAAALLAGAQE